MADHYDYGVAVHLYKPIIKRGVVDFAVGADWTPAAGDVKISKDGGAAANVTNLPTAIPMGNVALWDFHITATEMQAAKVRITVGDSATKVVEDVAFEIDTEPKGANLKSVDGDSTVVSVFRRALKSMHEGSVTGAATTTTLIDSSLVQANTDALKGRIVIFEGNVTAALKDQATDITAFTPGTDTLTFTAITATPASGDLYIIC